MSIRKLSDKKGASLMKSLKETKKGNTKAIKKAKQLVPREYGAGTLTFAGRKALIISALRKHSMYWKPISKCRKDASVGRKVNKDTGRMALHYKCKLCGDEVSAKKSKVDHIKPIVGVEGFTNWDSYIDAMYCEVENLQLLCKPCHDVKTKEERDARNEYIKAQKSEKT